MDKYVSWSRPRLIRFYQNRKLPGGRCLWMRGDRGTLIGGRLADRLGAKYRQGRASRVFPSAFVAGGGAPCRYPCRPRRGIERSRGAIIFSRAAIRSCEGLPWETKRGARWNNSALFLGISLGSLIGGQAVAIGSFETALIVSAAIALTGCIINWIVVPSTSDVLTNRPVIKEV